MRPTVAPWACLDKQWVQTCSSLTVLNPDFLSNIRNKDFRACMCAPLSRLGYPPPPWILKQGGLESFGQRLFSSIGKTKRIAFYFIVLFWRKKKSKLFWEKVIFWHFFKRFLDFLIIFDIFYFIFGVVYGFWRFVLVKKWKKETFFLHTFLYFAWFFSKLQLKVTKVTT